MNTGLVGGFEGLPGTSSSPSRFESLAGYSSAAVARGGDSSGGETNRSALCLQREGGREEGSVLERKKRKKKAGSETCVILISVTIKGDVWRREADVRNPALASAASCSQVHVKAPQLMSRSRAAGLLRAKPVIAAAVCSSCVRLFADDITAFLYVILT